MLKNILIATPNRGFGESLRLDFEEGKDSSVLLVHSGEDTIASIVGTKFDILIIDDELSSELAPAIEQSLFNRQPGQTILIIGSEDNPKTSSSLHKLEPDFFIQQPIYFPDLIKMLEKSSNETKPNPSSDQQNQFKDRPKDIQLEPNWLQDESLCAAHLTQQILNTDISAAVIFGTDEIFAFSGDIIEASADQIADSLNKYRDEAGKIDLVQFVTLKPSQVEYLLYGKNITKSSALASLFEPTFPLNQIRLQSKQLIQNLLTKVPQDVESEEQSHPEVQDIPETLPEIEEETIDDETFELDITELLKKMPPDPEIQDQITEQDWVPEIPESSKEISSQGSELVELEPLNLEETEDIFLPETPPNVPEIEPETPDSVELPKTEVEPFLPVGIQTDEPETAPFEALPEEHEPTAEEESKETLEAKNLPEQSTELSDKESEEAFLKSLDDIESFSLETDLILPWEKETENKFDTDAPQQSEASKLSDVPGLEITEKESGQQEKDTETAVFSSSGQPDESGLQELPIKQVEPAHFNGWEPAFNLEDTQPIKVKSAEPTTPEDTEDLSASEELIDQTEDAQFSGEPDRLSLATDIESQTPNDVDQKTSQFLEELEAFTNAVDDEVEEAPNAADSDEEEPDQEPAENLSPIEKTEEEEPPQEFSEGNMLIEMMQPKVINPENQIPAKETAVETGNNLYTCILIPNLPENILTGKLAKMLSEWLPQLSKSFGWNLKRISVRPEHLEWTVEVPPSVSTGRIIHSIRVHTSLWIYDHFPELKRRSPEDFWAPSQLVIRGEYPPDTETLRNFIQKTRHLPSFTNN